MGKWLDRLLEHENARKQHSQNSQKGAFEGFVSSTFAKSPKYPAVWRVSVLTDGKVCDMSLIDPNHDAEAAIKAELLERFGAERLLSVQRRCAD